MWPPSTLTREEFATASNELLRRVQDRDIIQNPLLQPLYQGWEWCTDPIYKKLGYLQRRTVAYECATTCEDDPVVDPAFNDVEIEAAPDPSEAQVLLVKGVFAMQQYVVWSATFRVPAFYFTMHDAAGTPASLDRVYNSSFLSKTRSLSEAPASVAAVFVLSPAGDNSTTPFPLLTQGEHPVLGIPCWYFHPCETSAAVQEIVKETIGEVWKESDEDLARWLEAWYMILGGVVDLEYHW